MMKYTKLFARGRGKGSILLISTMLVGSAVLRITSGAADALAAEQAGIDGATAAMIEEPQTLTPRPIPTRAEMSSLLSALKDREARVAALESKLEMREKALGIARTEIERRLDALQEAEARLSATLARADTAAEDDVARLTAVYENMKPKDAAALFEEMEPAFAAGFLGRMRADSAASIMAGLDPQTAYTISVILAGRNAGAPKT